MKTKQPRTDLKTKLLVNMKYPMMVADFKLNNWQMEMMMHKYPNIF